MDLFSKVGLFLGDDGTLEHFGTWLLLAASQLLDPMQIAQNTISRVDNIANYTSNRYQCVQLHWIHVIRVM